MSNNREATVDAVGMHERASATPERRTTGPSRAPGRAPDWATGDLSLREQQAWFAAIVSTPEAEVAPVDEVSAARLVTPSRRLSAMARLDIYRRSYHSRLVDCLLDDYPVLAAALGEAAFETLCRAYIAQHPSSGPSLNSFGKKLTDFCRSQALAEPGFAADLAKLEWAIVESIHAPSATPLTLAGLPNVANELWPTARFGVNPSLQILSLEYPANAYLHAYRRELPLPSTAAQSCQVAVYRTGRSVWRLELDVAKRSLVEALSAGKTLQEALESVQGALTGYSEDEAARMVAKHFQHSISSGLFCSLTFG